MSGFIPARKPIILPTTRRLPAIRRPFFLNLRLQSENIASNPTLGASRGRSHNGGGIWPFLFSRCIIAMIRFLKAVAWTAVAVGPLALAHWLPRGVAATAVIVYLLVLLRLSYSLVGILDVELPKLRNAELDALLDGVFSDYEADLTRFPFRAHIFRRCGMLPIEWLEMVYSYRTHSTDPDRGIRFFRFLGRPGEGLVWQTCEKGDVRYFRRDDVPDAKAAFHLRGRQDSATREVVAILALPLRQLVGNNGVAASDGPIGVLCFDALTSEAADALGQLFVQFRAGEQPALAELADRASLYV
jgi:hypothetical protein